MATLCLVGSSGSAASRVERAVQAGLHSARAVFEGRTWAQLLPHAVGTRDRTIVRLVARPTFYPTLLVDGMRTAQLPDFTG